MSIEELDQTGGVDSEDPWAKFAEEVAKQEEATSEAEKEPKVRESEQRKRDLDAFNEKFEATKREYEGNIPFFTLKRLDVERGKLENAYEEARISETEVLLPESQRKSFRKWARKPEARFYMTAVTEGLYRHDQGESLDVIKSELAQSSQEHASNLIGSFLGAGGSLEADEVEGDDSAGTRESVQFEQELRETEQKYIELARKYGGVENVPNDALRPLDRRHGWLKNAIVEAKIRETTELLPESQRAAFREYVEKPGIREFTIGIVADGVYRYSQGESLDSIKSDFENGGREREYETMIGFLEAGETSDTSIVAENETDAATEHQEDAATPEDVEKTLNALPSARLRQELAELDDHFEAARKQYGSNIPNEVKEPLNKRRRELEETIFDARINESFTYIPTRLQESFRSFMSSDESSLIRDTLFEGIQRYGGGESLDTIRDSFIHQKGYPQAAEQKVFELLRFYLGKE